MKKLLIAGAIVLGCLTGTAQVRTPMASPHAKIEQTVGLTDVKIDYSRPSARGRSVYGELVPFGKLWRTGAAGSGVDAAPYFRIFNPMEQIKKI